MIATDAHGRRILLAEYASARTREALWKYEADGGETYTIEVADGVWVISQDVWQEQLGDWHSIELPITIDAFLHQHAIHALVSGTFRARP